MRVTKPYTTMVEGKKEKLINIYMAMVVPCWLFCFQQEYFCNYNGLQYSHNLMCEIFNMQLKEWRIKVCTTIV